MQIFTLISKIQSDFNLERYFSSYRLTQKLVVEIEIQVQIRFQRKKYILTHIQTNKIKNF